MKHMPHAPLSGLTYTKPAALLREHVGKTIERLTAKVAVRQGRITALRKQHDLSDQDIITLLMLAAREQRASTYSLGSNVGASRHTTSGTEETREIPAGVVSALKAENEAIDAERGMIEHLNLVARNMPTEGACEVPFDNLAFLGF